MSIMSSRIHRAFNIGLTASVVGASAIILLPSGATAFGMGGFGHRGGGLESMSHGAPRMGRNMNGAISIRGDEARGPAMRPTARHAEMGHGSAGNFGFSSTARNRDAIARHDETNETWPRRDIVSDKRHQSSEGVTDSIDSDRTTIAIVTGVARLPLNYTPFLRRIAASNVGACYADKGCSGSKMGASLVTKEVCKTVDGGSWKDENGVCSNL